jgi:hypothetical protein
MTDLAKLFPNASASFLAKNGQGEPLGVARAQALRAMEIGNIGLPKTPAVKKPKPKKREPKPDTLTPFLVKMGLPAPTTEHRFHATRRWRFDYAWPEHRIALEVEGGVWTGGRHTRGAGFLGDMEKYNAAGEQGWRVFRVTPATAQTTETARMIRAAIAA